MYWEDRQKQLNEQLEKDEEKLRKKLADNYAKERKRLERNIGAYYQAYGQDNILEYRSLLQSISDVDRQLLFERMDSFAQKYPQWAHLLPVRESIYKLDRLEGLNTSIKMHQLEIGAVDNEMVGEHLLKYAQKGANAAAEQLGFGINYYAVNDDVIRAVINKNWTNGKNYSDRIWDNKEKLTNYICDDFAKSVVRGDSYQKCINSLCERFEKVSRNDAFRLIYTEDTFVTNEASAQTFEQYFTKYIFHIVDGNACKNCKSINNKVFDFEHRKPGLNFPPLHTWCRCYYTIEEDWDKWMDDYANKKQAESVAKSNKSDIIKLNINSVTINSIEHQIELPVEQRNTGKGNPNAILQYDVSLNKRQQNLLNNLSDFDSQITVSKKSVSMTDLSALTAKTGDEFAMFTKGNERLIIRGNKAMVNIDVEKAKQLANAGYRWSGHTHPGINDNCMTSSSGDHAVLDCFKQKTSVIYNSKGQYRTFEKED